MAEHLLHIGFPKTGSKYLQQWFAGNPQLSFSQWGLVGAPDTLELTQRAVFGSFKYYVTSCEGFVQPVRGYEHFDFRPGLVPSQASQLKMCKFLADTFHRCKVLAVTRGFREAVWSNYAELVRHGAAYSFEDFCRWLARSIDRGRNPLDYDLLLGAYGEGFGEANLIVLPYELLKQSPARFIAELERALGLDPHPPLPERIHASLSPQEILWYPRFARLVKSLPTTPRLRKRLFAKYVRAARQNRLGGPIRVLDRIRPAMPMTSDLVPDELIERFRGSAEGLRNRYLYRNLGKEYLF